MEWSLLLVSQEGKSSRKTNIVFDRHGFNYIYKFTVSHTKRWVCSSVCIMFCAFVEVYINSGTPKSSILIWFSSINHPFWGTPIFGNTHMQVPLHNYPRLTVREAGFFWHCGMHRPSTRNALPRRRRPGEEIGGDPTESSWKRLISAGLTNMMMRSNDQMLSCLLCC